MSRILKIEDFINESRGASFKNRTPDRFYKPESGKIQKQMMDKYNSILNDYFSDYDYYDFTLDNLNLEYETRNAADEFFYISAILKTGNPYLISIDFKIPDGNRSGEILTKTDDNLFDDVTDLTKSQINFLKTNGFSPYVDEDNGVSCFGMVDSMDKEMLLDSFYNWLTKEKGVDNVLTLADDIPEITRGNNLVNISFTYRPNEDTWHGSTEPTKARDVDFEDFVTDTVLAYTLLPLYYMDYICDKAFGD